MAIDLDVQTGLLPPGPHPSSVKEVEEKLVDAFPTSTSRRPIFDLWIHHRAAINLLVPITRQWLDGSFTTSKKDPGDADVVSFLPHAEVDVLKPAEQILLSGLFHGKKTKEVCRCDSYLVVEYPPGHPARHLTEAAERHWRGVYEQVRGNASARKGFLEVV